MKIKTKSSATKTKAAKAPTKAPADKVTALQATQEPTGGVAGWAIGLMEKLGAPGAGLAVALENLFPPLPSEVILPLAGFAATWRP